MRAVVGGTSGVGVGVSVRDSTAFSAATFNLRVSFAFLAASLRLFAAALRFRVALAFFAASLRFFAAMLAFLVAAACFPAARCFRLAAAFLPAARCFLLAAAFFAAALRSVAFFMVSGVYQKRMRQFDDTGLEWPFRLLVAGSMKANCLQFREETDGVGHQMAGLIYTNVLM